MKIVLAPDSFKGTMSSIKICSIFKEAILKYYPQCEIVSVPVADGGEGSLDCLYEILKGKIVSVRVKNALFRDISSNYLVVGDTAFIEMAQCAGLTTINSNELNPSHTTTYGVGQLVNHAITNNKIKKVVLCIGGSATNDCGCGMAEAMGVKFYNKKGESFVPVGGNLIEVCDIDISAASKYRNIEFITLCDVINPLFGTNGAAFVYAKQKGADSDMILRLDDGLKHIAKVITEKLGKDIAEVKGSGAAGGLGGGSVAFLNSKIMSGIETILNYADFNNIIKDCDFVITGEGRVDRQTAMGKVISGILKRTKPQKKPVFIIAGDVIGDLTELYNMGVAAILSTNRRAVEYKVAKLTAEYDLKETTETLMKILSFSVKKD